jgi:hypothetical protein
MDVKFDSWNVMSVYRAGSPRVRKYKLESVWVQQVKWYKGGTEPVSSYTFFYGNGNEDHELGTGVFVHKRIIPAVKRVEFFSDRMSYVILSGNWEISI